MPLPDQAQALRVPEGVATLQVLRVARNREGKPLAVREFHLPGGATWS
nr:hypothetical protein [Streptomyces sp. SPMA113]